MNKISLDSTALRAWSILLLLSVVWGSSFFFIKKSLVAFSWDQVAVLRISISMLAFTPILYKEFKKLPKEKLKYVFLMVLMGNGIPAFLFPIAQTQISSSLTGILNSLSPLFVFIVGIIFFDLTFIKRKFLGVLLGLIGAALLITYGTSVGEQENMWYALFAIAAGICYAVSSNIIKVHLSDVSSVTSTAVAFALIGPWALIYLFCTDFLQILETHPHAFYSLGSVSFLALMGTVMATLIFIKLIQMTSALFASTVAYLIPITAVFIGFLDGEIITAWHFLGMGLILGGVYLTRGK